jgi:hypothetical protein
MTVRVPYCIGARNRLTAGTVPTHADSQRLRVFRFGTNGGAPLQNPKTLAFARGDPKPPTMSPLRAVVSRGHIGYRSLTAPGYDN